jgi:microtubule-associated protein, RP/EB family
LLRSCLLFLAPGDFVSLKTPCSCCFDFIPLTPALSPISLQAYFTGRKELLDFFNDLLALNLAKIEQTATGAVACQITEYIYPGSIQMSKVNWEAKSDFEFVQNYKLLQAAFKKHNVERYVDVEKLIKAKYQDNLEFCQWLKAFFDMSGAYREDYDPVAARGKGKGAEKITNILRTNASQFNSKPIPTAGRRAAAPTLAAKTSRTTAATTNNRASARTTTTTTARNNASSLRENSSKSTTSSTATTKNHLTEAVLADASLMKRNADLTQKVADLEASLADVEIERDFYFEKLRDVEVILQVHKEQKSSGSEAPEKVFEKLFKVLYATAEENVTVSDSGEIVTKDELELLTEL